MSYIVDHYQKEFNALDLSNKKSKYHTTEIDIESLTEKELRMEPLQSNKPLFIFSENEHNEVITLNQNWFRFLHRWKKGEQW